MARLNGYYSQNYATVDPSDANRYLLVALSLSTDDDSEGEHRVLTMLRTKKDYFYYKGTLKDRWIEVMKKEPR